MNDSDKSKDQLLDELKDLRQRVIDLEDSEEKLQAMKFTVDRAMEPVVWIAPNGRPSEGETARPGLDTRPCF
ncbi:hypothetical protein D1AOALGA4SA_3073 [Olavius algarvensis Delta 1 endosymbiont]|nr:hypothetical protein D1AOALGA4SA_3073 [Olavius algarvensis Delta 1 endosymbiont]